MSLVKVCLEIGHRCEVGMLFFLTAHVKGIKPRQQHLRTREVIDQPSAENRSG